MPKAFILAFLLFFCSALFADTGFGLSPSFVYDTMNPSVSLLNPLPGEIWFVGQVREITWNATDTNLVADSIDIYYSLDDGATYFPLITGISNTGTYTLQIPLVVSDMARISVKAKDSFGNVSSASNPLILTYDSPPPMQVQNVSITIAGDDVIITWQPVTENVMNEPILPDGYMLFESDTPSYNPSDYTLLAYTPETQYIYLSAPLQFSDKFFYVVAYKDYTGRLRSLLESATESRHHPLTLQEIRNHLSESGKGGGK